MCCTDCTLHQFSGVTTVIMYAPSALGQLAICTGFLKWHCVTSPLSHYDKINATLVVDYSSICKPNQGQKNPVG